MAVAATMSHDRETGGGHCRAWHTDDAFANYVLLHGPGEHPGVYERFAESLNEQRINVWALEEIGLQGPDELVENAIAIAGIAESDAPGLPLLIAGHWLGGVTAALALVRTPERFAGAVLSATPLTQIDTAGVAPPRRALLAPAWAELDARLAQVDRPILLVRGAGDPVVPAEDVRAWAARLRQGRLVELVGARHDVLDDIVHGRVPSTISSFVHQVGREAARGGAAGR